MNYMGVDYKNQKYTIAAQSPGRRSHRLPMFLGTFLLLGLLAAPTFAQGSWTTEYVTSNRALDTGRTSSLVVDRLGNLHVAYYDKTMKRIWYAFRSKGSAKWDGMTVVLKDASPFFSLAIDAESHPHLAYTLTKEKEDGLRCASWNGHVWRNQLIDQDTISSFNSIQVDAQGNPRISYFDNSHDGHAMLRLKYAYFDGKTWYVQTVDSTPTTGKYNSLALDGSGNPHIAYSEGTLGDLLYAHWDGKEWKIASADVHSKIQETNIHKQSISYVGIGNSIALDSTGNPHIAYFEREKQVLKYASWENGSWKTEVADQPSAISDAGRASLQIDGKNQPHIAYYDAGVGVLKYVTRDDKGWSAEVVDHDRRVGEAPSIALDRDGIPWISYYDEENHTLRVAHRVAKAAPAAAATAQTK